METYEPELAEVLELWQKISEKFERRSGPPSPSQQLSKPIEEAAGLDEAPDAFVYARAVPARQTPAPATKTRRGRRPTHNWPLIELLDAEYCRTYRAETGRPPSWKKRAEELEKLGAGTLHLKTLQRRLPKIALLKERNSRSI